AQWYALTVRGEVARAKVADGRHSRALGDHRRHTEVERCGDSALRFLPKRLTGTTDALHALKTERRAIGHMPRRRRERFTQHPVQQSEVFGFAWAAIDDTPKKGAQLSTVGLVQRVQQLDLQIDADAGRLHKRRIDAVAT